MTDIVDRARTMINTISYAQANGIGQVYPDNTVVNVIAELVVEIDEWRSTALTLGAETPTQLLFSGPSDLIERLRAFGRDCVLHGDMTPSGQRALTSILSPNRRSEQ